MERPQAVQAEGTMTTPVREPTATAGAMDDETLKLAELRRIKMLATAVLVACFALFLVARLLEGRVPGMAFVAAFAEAATIGGIADWYAVVVLFRHPMGLKVPHTAIVPKNQERIADNMGAFLERNFLSREVIGARLSQIDFAGEIGRALDDSDRSRELARFLVRLVPDVLAAVERTGIRERTAARVAREANRVKVAPVARDFLDSFVADRRFEGLLDDILVALDRVLSDPDTMETVEKRVAAELPSVLYILQTEGVIVRRIVKAVRHMLEEVRDRPDHELRAEFRTLIAHYVERMKRSQRFERRVETMKADLLASPRMASLADRAWDTLTAYARKQARAQDPDLARQLAPVIERLGERLMAEPALRDTVNGTLVAVVGDLLEERKETVSGFVADEVRAWDFRQLVRLIEANVGRDLQFIRFNGMLVGGIAGVGLHLIELALGTA